MIFFANSQCPQGWVARGLAVAGSHHVKADFTPRSLWNMPMSRCWRRTSRWQRSSRLVVRSQEMNARGKSTGRELRVGSTSVKPLATALGSLGSHVVW